MGSAGCGALRPGCANGAFPALQAVPQRLSSLGPAEPGGSCPELLWSWWVQAVVGSQDSTPDPSAAQGLVDDGNPGLGWVMSPGCWLGRWEGQPFKGHKGLCQMFSGHPRPERRGLQASTTYPSEKINWLHLRRPDD